MTIYYCCPVCLYCYDNRDNEAPDHINSQDCKSVICSECAKLNFDSTLLDAPQSSDCESSGGGVFSGSSSLTASDFYPVGDSFFDGYLDRPSCNFCLMLDCTVKLYPLKRDLSIPVYGPKFYYRGSVGCKSGLDQVLCETAAGNFALIPSKSNQCGKPVHQTSRKHLINVMQQVRNEKSGNHYATF